MLICALRHIPTGVQRANFLPSGGRSVAVVSVTDPTKAVLRTLLRNALPLIGLGFAVIVNAALIDLLRYFVLRLV